jgi:predicted double-glycine peptidase
VQFGLTFRLCINREKDAEQPHWPWLWRTGRRSREGLRAKTAMPHEHGISAESMRSYLRQHSFQAFAVKAGKNDLEQQLRAGRPLIVALRPSGQKELHFVVVDGIDSQRGTVTVNDPAERKLLTREWAGFEKEWSATHNWMLLALPVVVSQ